MTTNLELAENLVNKAISLYGKPTILPVINSFKEKVELLTPDDKNTLKNYIITKLPPEKQQLYTDIINTSLSSPAPPSPVPQPPPPKHKHKKGHYNFMYY